MMSLYVCSRICMPCSSPAPPLLTLYMSGSPACGLSRSVCCSAIEVELVVVEWSGVVPWGMDGMGYLSKCLGT